MRYIAITDNPCLWENFKRFPDKSDAYLVIHHSGKYFRIEESRGWRKKPRDSSPRLLDLFHLKPNDRLFFHFNGRDALYQVLQNILVKKTDFQGLVVLNKKDDLAPPVTDPRISVFPLSELLDSGLHFKWDFIETNRKVKALQSLFESARNVLILMQHDPDPDAIASALALRVLLNRNKTTAPIGTFGKITWRENLTMAQLLDIDVVQVSPQSLGQFEKIAVVDAQPRYFKGLCDRFDAVIDHHPDVTTTPVPYIDIKTSYGSTATILTEYLLASNIKLNQRLATALLHGIKTDTLFLGREVSVNDFEAFKTAWPLANHALLKKMESPELDPGEIALFTKALKNRKIFGRALYTFLGETEKEDIIPRLADFCLQIGEIDWSMVCGIYEGNIVISVRNIGIPRSAGLLVQKLFGQTGQAGGHSSMAKAVVPLKKFKEIHGAASLRTVSHIVMESFRKEVG
ncbi:MAG: DHH family phosphoesterase [Nitrospinae bacterium]|nr:DHH family phosphoesterase [Nitrospinota bacterium]